MLKTIIVIAAVSSAALFTQVDINPVSKDRQDMSSTYTVLERADVVQSYLQLAQGSVRVCYEKCDREHKHCMDENKWEDSDCDNWRVLCYKRCES